MTISIRTLPLVACLCGSLIAGSASACNVPVFRYALEHWSPDRYRGVIFHEGPLSEAQQPPVERLTEQADLNLINLQVRSADVEQLSAEDKALLQSLGEVELPLFVLQYPSALKIDRVVWTQRLDDAFVSKLLDSPARKDLAKRLADGQTAVWVLLESGNAEQDQAARDTLTTELQRLQSTLELPELTDSPEDVILEGPHLRIEFSLLTISADDAQEAALIAQLLAAEEDLQDLDEPMVFPVFGRGRGMLPLVGAGITAANLSTSAAFLTGGCSCQVKNLNPGFDLLMAVQWTEILGWSEETILAMKEEEKSSTTPELVPIASGKPETPSPRNLEAIADTQGEEVAAATPAEDEIVVTESSAPPANAPSMTMPAFGLFAWLLLPLLMLGVVGMVFMFARR